MVNRIMVNRKFVYLVIVNNFDIVGVTVFPAKADAILLVNADAVLATTIAMQRLKTIPGGNGQILQYFSSVQSY